MKIVSVVCHPLLIATHLSTILLLIAPELVPRIRPQVIPEFLLVVFLITAVMPAFSIFLLKTFKYISDLELVKRGERIIPFVFILFYYGIASYLFWDKLEMGTVFNTVMISATTLILIVLIVTFRFKISIHATAVWSAVGYITAMLVTNMIEIRESYYLVVVMAGLTTTSRLYLGYHSPKEVWSGTLLGFAYSSLVVFVLL